MEDCDYCSASFEEETAYYEHLDGEHADELGAIDRRRVEQELEGDEFELPTGPLILVGVIAFALLLIVYVTVFMGGASDTGPPAVVNGIEVESSPTEQNSVHHHGRINVTIDGQELDFSRPEFQRASEFPAFHFENGDGSTWHGHAKGITLQYAMATLGIRLGNGVVEYDGTTYRNSDADTTVRIEVDGEAVNPVYYTLSGPASEDDAADGDHIRITVTTDE